MGPLLLRALYQQAEAVNAVDVTVRGAQGLGGQVLEEALPYFGVCAGRARAWNA